MQYSNFKDTLQNIASQIGNVEQEVEEHKYVMLTLNLLCFHDLCDVSIPKAAVTLASTTATTRPPMPDFVKITIRLL